MRLSLLSIIVFFAVNAVTGCASSTLADYAACPDGEEQVRIGPRGKGTTPQYVCREAS